MQFVCTCRQTQAFRKSTIKLISFLEHGTFPKWAVLPTFRRDLYCLLIKLQLTIQPSLLVLTVTCNGSELLTFPSAAFSVIV